MSNQIDLRPDARLLNPDFNGYKLSLDGIPTYGKLLEEVVDHVKPSEEQYSFLHVKLFSLHNHLYASPYNINEVYYISKNWKILKPIFTERHVIEDFRIVLEIPSNNVRKPGHYNLSLQFASKNIVVLSDGAGTLHIADSSEDSWKIIHSEDVLDVSFVIADARCESVDDCRLVHVLMHYVEERKKDTGDGTVFQTALEWVVYSENEKVWCKKVQRKLVTLGSVDYAVIGPRCDSLHVATEKCIKFVYDSEKPIEEKAVEQKTNVPKEFTWLQTPNDITIWLPLRYAFDEIKLALETGYLRIHRFDETLLEGNLWHPVDELSGCLTLHEGQIKLQIQKNESGQMWQKLFKDNDTGEEILDPELVSEVHQRLAHLCTENTEENKEQTVYSSEQLEECDIQSSETAVFVRISAENHTITHEISLSSLQWLFKVQLEPEKVPAVVLRHDVDACVWQFADVSNTWDRKHVGTFLAFGYVQASKTQKKFLVCAPNLSYVSICDTNRHIYFYRQPSAIHSELRNRKSGLKVTSVLKQQLVSLDTNDEVLGVHATDLCLYVLTEKNFYVLHVNFPLQN